MNFIAHVRDLRYLKIGECKTVIEGKTNKQNILMLNKESFRALHKYLDESKFNDEVAQVQQEDQNITKMIEKTLELEEMKKDLTSAFNVVSPVFSESELVRKKSFIRYLMISGLFMLAIGVIFLVQITQFSQAWSLFLMFGIIPIAIFLFSLFILSNIWRSFT